jgi:predicted DNA-binding mobile mystery protein A
MGMTRDNNLARQRLDERFDRMRGAIGPRPHAGWIRAIRDALGMSGPELARRMEVSPQSLYEIERNEVSGSIRFETLTRAASALDCDLEYVLVPRRGLQDSVERRAREKATHRIEPIAHHSRLEAQSLTGQAAEAQLDDLAASLIDRRGLWSEDAGR